MRILTISAFFPPYVIGGAEICAYNLSNWCADNGHEVAVLTSAPTAADETWGTCHEGLRLYRVATPHLYPVAAAANAPAWKKPIWHLQDLFDPRNQLAFERVIEEFRPDFIHIHWIQGLGYNGLKVIARHQIPTAITLHDLSLLCVRTTMFRGSEECIGQCGACRFSAGIKLGYLQQIKRLGFISPSQANLDRISSLLPIDGYPRFHILNPNRYPVSEAQHQPSSALRLLFVGRLEQTKGVNLLLEALEPLAATYDFTLTMMGSGPEQETLRRQYGHHSWLKMAGQVPMQQVADEMAISDLLLVPSIWAENSPGVVFQALAASLPVMGSAKGGIPELVHPGKNGFLVPSGDVQAWRDALEGILKAPEQLDDIRAHAALSGNAAEFDYDVLARRILDAFDVIRAQ